MIKNAVELKNGSNLRTVFKNGSAESRVFKIVLTTLNTGMSKGKILKLRWSDIDFDKNILYVNESKNGESNKIPINRTLKDSFLKLKKESCSNKHDHVFIN